ncbi:MAG: hypothetical protein EOP39_21675 [Rubrivivax sp.]|nr:MAG: hypothetical protein EOP39_21675 [Rubrivivax sp.]
MKKIVSQIAGAVAVVSVATFAFAQTNDTSNTTAADPNSSVNAPSKDSRFGAGANNGSVYTPAIRRNELKAGNVNNESDEIVTKTVVAPAAPAPIVTATPEPAPVAVVQPAAPAVVATPEPMPAPTYTATAPAAEPMRPARADRN